MRHTNVCLTMHPNSNDMYLTTTPSSPHKHYLNPDLYSPKMAFKNTISKAYSTLNARATAGNTWSGGQVTDRSTMNGCPANSWRTMKCLTSGWKTVAMVRSMGSFPWVLNFSLGFWCTPLILRKLMSHSLFVLSLQLVAVLKAWLDFRLIQLRLIRTPVTTWVLL